MKQTLTVKGMHCNACKMLVTEALEETKAKNVNVTLDEKKQIGTVTLDSDLSKAQLKKLIEEQGDYEVA
jgi:copper chaperone CopZ